MFCRFYGATSGNTQHHEESAKAKDEFSKCANKKNREAHLRCVPGPDRNHRRGPGPGRNRPPEGGGQMAPPGGQPVPGAAAPPVGPPGPILRRRCSRRFPIGGFTSFHTWRRPNRPSLVINRWCSTILLHTHHFGFIHQHKEVTM